MATQFCKGHIAQPEPLYAICTPSAYSLEVSSCTSQLKVGRYIPQPPCGVVRWLGYKLSIASHSVMVGVR